MIRGTTKLLGVIGHPIHHSLSPVMHNAALRHLGLDYVYLPLPVRPEDLGVAIAGFAAIGLEGFNITIPHKQAVMPLLTHLSETAQAVGAVNTVWWTEQGWQGTNTDVQGFLAPLEVMERDWSQMTAIVLGNGGAARAVVAACAQLGLQHTWVVGRQPDKLAAFHQSWTGSPLAGNLQVYPWEQLADLLPQAGLLVNTTPIGMASHSGASPVGPGQLALLPNGAIVYDLIYTPRPTQLLHLAQSRGLWAIDGLEMLVQQGAAALEIWTGQSLVGSAAQETVEVMRQALEEYLAGT